jgi:hypothetical protein
MYVLCVDGGVASSSLVLRGGFRAWESHAASGAHGSGLIEHSG